MARRTSSRGSRAARARRTVRSPLGGGLSLGLLLLLPGCTTEQPSPLELVIDTGGCLGRPADPGASPLFCAAALPERLDARTVACLAIEPDGAAGAVQPFRYDPAQHVFGLLPPEVPLELRAGATVSFRLFVLRPSEQPDRCAAFDAATPCAGASGPGAACLFALGPTTLPLEGQGTIQVSFGAPGLGGPSACELQCNDPCDPAAAGCRRLCADEAHPWRELCNRQDDDCDGETDEGFALGGPDGELALGAPCPGSGGCPAGVVVCAVGRAADHACCSADPACGRTEQAESVCDGLDNDCDGLTDEALRPPAGFSCLQAGICAGTLPSCGGAAGWVCRYPASHEEQPERSCDGLDNDCDGQTDEELVVPPGTTCLAAGLCAGTAPSCEGPDGWVCRYPAGHAPGPETSCDGLDNDCNGLVDDGLELGQPCPGTGGLGSPCREGAWECDPTLHQRRCSTHPCGSAYAGTAESCNGLDDDCDGEVDEGAAAPPGTCPTAGVCAAAVPRCEGATGWICLYPVGYEGSIETTCDGLDNDCDGSVDEQLAVPPLGCPHLGVCAASAPGCGGARGWVCSLEPTYQASETLCDGLDNDCDGLTDVGCACDAALAQPRSCGLGVGACVLGAQRCEGGVWGGCVGAGAPQQEVCNGLDDDCDGRTDEEVTAPPDTCLEQGVCQGAGQSLRCAGAAGWLCSYPAAYEAGAETRCDGLDNDCDGQTDEHFSLGSACPATGGPGSPCGPGVWECDPITEGRICSTQPGGSRYPGVAESCNGADDDCDGAVDEELGTTSCGVGSCRRTVQSCLGGQPQACTPGAPQIEVLANGQDDDCDGAVDENPCRADESYWSGSGHCYFQEGTVRFWDAQRDACTARGGYLLAIDDASENAFVYDLAPGTTRWIGLNDQAVEGTWVWGAGSNSAYRNWSPGEPAGGNGSNCADLRAGENGGWHDHSCNSGRAAVCEANR